MPLKEPPRHAIFLATVEEPALSEGLPGRLWSQDALINININFHQRL